MTGWSFDQRSPTSCDVSNCDHEALTMRRPTLSCCTIKKKNLQINSGVLVPVSISEMHIVEHLLDSSSGYFGRCWPEYESRNWHWSGWGCLCDGIRVLAHRICCIWSKNWKAPDKQNMGELKTMCWTDKEFF